MEACATPPAKKPLSGGIQAHSGAKKDVISAEEESPTH